MASSSFRPSKRHTIINLVDSDDDGYDTQSYINVLQITKLKAEVTRLETEVLNCKAALEHSEVDLKYSRERLKTAIASANKVQHSEPTQSRISTNSKRPRSPSPESDPPVQSSKRRKEKMRQEQIKPGPISPGKPKLEMYVSVPSVESTPSRPRFNLKVEKESPKNGAIHPGCFSSLTSETSSPSQSDDRHTLRQPRDSLVEQSVALSFLSEPDSISNARSGKNTPGCQSHGDRVVVSTCTPSIRPEVPPLATTQKVRKTNDITNQVSSTMAADLQLMEGLVIRPPPFNVPVSRLLLQRRYGGSSQTLIQEIKKERIPTGLKPRRLIFPDHKHNPHLPLKPGASGFIYASREDVENKSFSLFVQCTTSKKAVWKYFGEYQTERRGMMSTQHFRSLSDQVHVAWSKRIQSAKSPASMKYVAMRVRIRVMRETGIKPLEEELKVLMAEDIQQSKEVVANTEMEKEEEKKRKGKEEAEILEAMLRGQEHLDIVRVTCTSYDHAFAEDIRQTYNRAKPDPQSTWTKSKFKNPKASTSGKGTPIRSRRSARNIAEFDDDLDDTSGSQDQVEGSVSDRQLRPRKSAPHVLHPDYESEEDEQSYTEELDSDRYLTDDL